MRIVNVIMPGVIAVCCAAVPGVAAAQTRTVLPIGYVSMQRILTESEDAKAGAKQLDTLRQARAKDLQAKREALDTTRLQIANAGGYFSSSRREQLRIQEKRQEAELQQGTQQAQTDLVELQRKIQEGLRAEINRIVNALAVQRGFQYVLNQDAAVILAPAGVDLTKDVLDRMSILAAERAVAAATAEASGGAKK